MSQSSTRIHNLGTYQDVVPFYDLHAPKDQEELLAFFTHLVQRHARRPVRDLLEFGCGTGRVALPLVQRGYNVVATDASATMLDFCGRRAAALGLSLDLRQELMQDFAEADRYDALIAIFGAIAFLVDDEPLQRFFSACKAALRPGGFLLVDVPNGLTGLAQPWAGVSAEVCQGDGMTLERFLNQIPDVLHGTTRYRDTGFVRTAEGVRWYQEEYILRIFSLPLLRLLLKPVGFQRMTCYCNWRDREPMLAPYSRLILVLEK